MKRGYLRRAEQNAPEGDSTGGLGCGVCRREYVAGAQSRQPWNRCVHCGTLFCHHCSKRLTKPAMVEEILICALCYGPTRPL